MERLAARFGCADNALVFSRQQLGRRSLHAAPTLAPLHEKIVAEALEKTDDDRVIRRVKGALAARLERGPRDIDVVARAIGMSARTLHRAFKRWTGTTPARWRERGEPTHPHRSSLRPEDGL